MESKKIIIFGDSLLRPIIINEANRYAISNAVDWQQIEQKLNVSIDNRSRLGATIKYGNDCITQYLKGEELADAAIIEYGGNDCDYNWQDVAKGGIVPPKTDPKEFESQLCRLIEMVCDRGIRPILMTLPPISSLRYYEWIKRDGLNEENIMAHLVDVEVISRHQEYYNNIVMSVALKNLIDLVDVRQKFLLRKDYMDLMCVDGIHPNEKGINVTVQAFLEYFG